ncbi:hypothetical protein A9Q81_11930, partial [Gammaproteobacteria bacterium 42_54_T18]
MELTCQFNSEIQVQFLSIVNSHVKSTLILRTSPLSNLENHPQEPGKQEPNDEPSAPHELLSLMLMGKPLRLITDSDSVQSLYWGEQLVSCAELAGKRINEIAHRFELQAAAAIQPAAPLSISLNLQAQDNSLSYQLWVEQRQQESGECPLPTDG